LVDKVKEFVEEELETIDHTNGYKILEASVMPDHIRLFIDADPFDSPNIVKIFKRVTRELESSQIKRSSVNNDCNA
jgi:REP element-mobilizing transposase RayT